MCALIIPWYWVDPPPPPSTQHCSHQGNPLVLTCLLPENVPLFFNCRPSTMSKRGTCVGCTSQSSKQYFPLYPTIPNLVSSISSSGDCEYTLDKRTGYYITANSRQDQVVIELRPSLWHSASRVSQLGSLCYGCYRRNKQMLGLEGVASEANGGSSGGGSTAAGVRLMDREHT